MSMPLPSCLCGKKDGSLRICTDFSQLNARTIKDAHLLPYQSDCLAPLNGNTYFSTMDLTLNYNVPMAEDDKKCTAITIPMGRTNKCLKICVTVLLHSCEWLWAYLEIWISVVCCATLMICLFFAVTGDVALRRLEIVFQRVCANSLKLSPNLDPLSAFWVIL